MMPIIIALPLRYVGRKFASQKILVKYLVNLSFRVYSATCRIELPTLCVFTSGTGSWCFRFRGFFFWFRKIFPLNGRFFLWFWRKWRNFGSWRFRLLHNFRMHNRHWMHMPLRIFMHRWQAPYRRYWNICLPLISRRSRIIKLLFSVHIRRGSRPLRFRL